MLSPRKRMILKSLLEQHHVSGEPVASGGMASRGDMGLSSATLRHELAELEEQGYLFHPHASAGRTPTEQGYRFYVQELLTAIPLSTDTQERIGLLYQSPINELDVLLHQTIQELADLTHCPGVAVAPRLSESVLSHVELIPLSPKKVLAVLVTKSGLVKHKMIELQENVSAEEVRKIGGFMQQAFKDSSISEVRQTLLSKLEREKENYSDLLKKTIALSRHLFSDEVPEDLYVERAASILSQLDNDADEAQKIMSFLSQPTGLNRFFQEHVDDEGVQVFIGSENPYPEMRRLSMIIASYEVDGVPTGTLGIIGPMRMEYDRAIALVEYAARAMSEFLNKAA